MKLSKNSKFLLLNFMLSVCVTGLYAQNGPPNARNAQTGVTENDIFPIYSVAIPQDIALEVGGMTFMPNDRLAVCTRHGDVWIISNPYSKNGTKPVYTLFASGLHEALGLNFIKGDLYVTQRAELTRLRDLDGDGVADQYSTMYTWPLAGNYHEYAYGPILDKDGNMVLTLNLGWIGFGESLSKWHGWMLKLTPDFKMKPFAAGFRSPAGFALNSAGDIFYAENQGDWVGSGNVTHIEEGDFVGNPAGLIWSNEPGSPVKLQKKDIPDTGEPKFDVAKRLPGLKTPSVWIPHTVMGNSTSGILNYDDKGYMGPFKGQLFVGDQSQSKINRIFLEKVKGVYQGIVFPFRKDFSSGVFRMDWGSDGSMFVGMTSRGWSSTGKGLFGLQRMAWSGITPFEMKTVKAQPDGFEIEFTKPVDVKTARDAESYKVMTFTYKYHHIYGSPAINQGNCPIKAIVVSADRMKVRLVLDSLKEGYVHEIRAEGIKADSAALPLLHNFGYYTLNRIPDGDKVTITAENRVVAPVVDHSMHMDMGATAVKGKTATTPLKAVAASDKHLTKQPASWTNGPEQTIVIGTKPGLKFDVESFTLKPGAKVKLTFVNSDDMLHNFVFTAPNAGNEVGEMVMKMGINGEKYNFVPTTPKVLYHTILLQPGKSDTIYFVAPTTPGEYQYICSYPGHYAVMRGVIRVEK